ncbi:hypothetical protein ANN_05892 [Periplaneta americana]|uniref:Uncharacterized protein n=1 Tax=Periplaneta americana TaxID=6978 RepID=A0ABQ8TC23_PERAM|nr:hypothetical protein ANN_05892 [Periplaneta americana]
MTIRNNGHSEKCIWKKDSENPQTRLAGGRDIGRPIYTNTGFLQEARDKLEDTVLLCRLSICASKLHYTTRTKEKGKKKGRKEGKKERKKERSIIKCKQIKTYDKEEEFEKETRKDELMLEKRKRGDNKKEKEDVLTWIDSYNLPPNYGFHLTDIFAFVFEVAIHRHFATPRYERSKLAPAIDRLLVQDSYNIKSYHIISYHIISYYIISYHIISYHIISYYFVRNGNIKIGDLSFEEVEKFKYLRATVTNINDTREEIKRRINMGNACYYSAEKLLSSSLL